MRACPECDFDQYNIIYKGAEVVLKGDILITVSEEDEIGDFSDSTFDFERWLKSTPDITDFNVTRPGKQIEVTCHYCDHEIPVKTEEEFRAWLNEEVKIVYPRNVALNIQDEQHKDSAFNGEWLLVAAEVINTDDMENPDDMIVRLRRTK